MKLLSYQRLFTKSDVENKLLLFSVLMFNFPSMVFVFNNALTLFQQKWESRKVEQGGIMWKKVEYYGRNFYFYTYEKLLSAK